MIRIFNSSRGIFRKFSNINAAALTIAPKKFYHDNITEEIMLKPFRHYLRNTGVGLLNRMYPVFNQWLNVPEDKMKEVVDLMDEFYAAFFMIDDVYDDTPMRLKIITAHRIYGVPLAINTTLCVIFEAYKKCKLLHTDAYGICAELCLSLCRTQAREMYLRDMIQCPTQEEYEMNTMKMTGAFYLLGIKLLQLFSENKSDIDNLVLKIALYAQIHDDYIDCSETKIDKNYCSDLTTGNFSFPMIHAINNHPDDIEIKYLLKTRSRDKDIHEHFIKLLDRYGSYDYTKERLTKLLEEIEMESKKFVHNPKMDEFIIELKSCNIQV